MQFPLQNGMTRAGILVRHLANSMGDVFFLHIVPQQVWRMFHVTNDFFHFFLQSSCLKLGGRVPRTLCFKLFDHKYTPRKINMEHSNIIMEVWFRSFSFLNG